MKFESASKICFSFSTLTVEGIFGFGPQRREAEGQIRHPLLLPIRQWAEWQQALGWSDALLLIARERSGAVLRAVTCGIARTRALPGHRIYRAERFGVGASSRVDEALLKTLKEVAHADPRCVRVHVELFEPDADKRARLRTALANLSFVQVAKPRMYERTLAVRLNKTTEEMLAMLSPTARRHIRAAVKRGLEVRGIADPSLAPRLHEMMRETFGRTRAVAPDLPWKRIIELSAAAPASSRIAGLYRTGISGPESLVSFAWGILHGSCAVYADAASVRRADLGNFPLGYAVLWDLILWAREQTAASWFDLGGTTDGGDDDPYAGITAFKRQFSKEVIQVGEEWIFEPRPVRAAITRIVGDWGLKLWRLRPAPDL